MIVLPATLLSACSPRGLISWGSGWNAVAASDGILYVGTRQGEVLALQGITGDFPSVKWRFAPEKPSGDEIDLRVGSVFGMPAVGEKYVYVADQADRDGSDGLLYALRKDRGSSNRLESDEWAKGVEGGIVGGPALVEEKGLVLVGSDDGNLYAFHTTTDTDEKIIAGDKAWIFKTDAQVWSAPVVGDGIVYLGSMDGHIYAVSLEVDDLVQAQRLVWKYQTGGAVISKPLLLDGMVIVGSFDNKLYALDAKTGTFLWSFKGDDWFWAGPTSDGEFIFAPTMEGTVYALDKGGVPIWIDPFEADSPIVSTPVLVDDTLVLASDRGSLYILRTRSGEQHEFFKSLGDRVKGSLSSEGNVVFVGVTDETVRAVNATTWGPTMWCFHTQKDSCKE